MKTKLFTALRIFISIFLIGLLFWLMRDSLPNIYSAIKSANRPLLILGFFVYLSTGILIGFRLQKVLSVQKINLTVKEATYLTFIGYFFNNFMPTSFGGDVLKAYYAGKKSNKRAGAFAGVFMDRVLALLPFTLIPVVTIVFFTHNIDNKLIIAAVYALFFGSIVFLWLLLHKNTAKYLTFIIEPFKDKLWYEKVKSGYKFLNLYAKHKIVLSWSFILSAIAQIAAIVAIYIYARALGIDSIGIGIFFIIVPIVAIMTLMPSLNGLGVREGAFVYFLKSYMPAEKAFAVSILVLASLIVFSIIGGCVYGFKKNIFTLQDKEMT